MKCYWIEDENGRQVPKNILYCRFCGDKAVYIPPHVSPVVKSQEDHTVVDWMEIGAYYYHYSENYDLGCHQRICLYNEEYMDTLTDNEEECHHE